MTEYEATQKQRYIERQIRKYKREVAGLDAAGIDSTDSRNRLAKWQQRQRDFIEQTGLKRDYNREVVEGYSSKAKKSDKLAENAKKTVARSEKSGIINNKNSETRVLNSAKRLDEHDIDDCYNTANPLYFYGIQFQENCQRCVSAYEARRRGYNVAASERLFDGTDTLPYMTHEKGWANVYENGVENLITPTGNSSTAVKQSLMDMMTSYGDGARAIVRVRWQGGGGHVFIAEQVNGVTQFIDPQSGKRDCSNYFNDGMIKPESTRLLRIDDKSFTDLIEKCIIVI